MVTYLLCCHYHFCNICFLQSSLPPEEAAMTEEALDMDIEPDQLIVDETAVSSEEINPSELIPEEVVVPTQTPGTTSLSSGGNHSTKQQFEIFLHNLANCVNKELIDSAAIEFLLNLNTKNNRKKLTNALFGVQRYVVALFICVSE